MTLDTPSLDTTSADFLSLMSTFPTGVAVVTTFDQDGLPRGMTCSSLCSVALTPPTLLVCLRSASPTLLAALWKGTFAVNLLRHRARAVAELFSRGASDRFDRVAWQAVRGGAGPHLADHAHAVADCRISRAEQVGDHTVVFGEVFKVASSTGGTRPLLYGMRQYSAWPRPLSSEETSRG